MLKDHKAYVAGGAITSLFSNRDINDIDIYFRNEESAISFLADIWEERRHIVSHTKKATLTVYDDVEIQLIHFKYFETPEDIFKTFDFTACMGCFDFSNEEFTLHSDFLKHNSQRILKFNKDTDFPIVSMLRVQKYEEKGYKISKPEFIRIILTCKLLEINTYEELKEQLGGMYGINYDKLFEDVEDQEFDLEAAIDKIADIALSEDYFKEPIPIEFKNIEDLISNISTLPTKCLYINEELHRISWFGLLESIDELPENHIILDTEKFFNENKFYKFVNKKDDKYFSFYDKNFEYVIGQEAVAKGASDPWGDHGGKLHMNEKKAINDSTYRHSDGAVLIELSVKVEDFVDANEGHIRVKKATVIREVPVSEYK
ncbi:hypothetical protein KDN24_06775 [Bacillus sp. Bva_UNVM-123]